MQRPETDSHNMSGNKFPGYSAIHEAQLISKFEAGLPEALGGSDNRLLCPVNTIVKAPLGAASIEVCFIPATPRGVIPVIDLDGNKVQVGLVQHNGLSWSMRLLNINIQVPELLQ